VLIYEDTNCKINTRPNGLKVTEEFVFGSGDARNNYPVLTDLCAKSLSLITLGVDRNKVLVGPGVDFLSHFFSYCDWDSQGNFPATRVS